ncbi:MAG: hypothetical protein FJX74_07395, partial [Armatimonadetes bacterium]|nr:hypothetical protein [Armatimonadota bacterium]
KIKGDFSLPSGYALSDLSGTGTLILEIGGQAVSAEVVGKSTGRGHGKWSRRFGRCRDGGRLWFTSDRSSRRGGDLKFEGEIEADLVNDNTGLVTVTLVLPVTAGGDLAGSETVTCRTKRNEWEYKAHCDRPCAITGGAVTSLSAAPTTTGAQIVFTLSGDADVSATILNIAGRPVRTLATDRAVTAGVNVLLWNGLSDAGLRAPAGAYLVRVTAHAGDGGSSSSVALLGLGR